MVTRKKKNGQVNHEQTARNNAGFTAEPATPVTLTEIISFNAMGLCLGLDKHFRLYKLGVGLPPVCEKDCHVQALQSFEHFCEGRTAAVCSGRLNLYEQCVLQPVWFNLKLYHPEFLQAGEVLKLAHK